VRLTVSSVLPAPVHRVWPLLQRSDTYTFIAEGFITSGNAATLPEVWQVGDSVDLQPRLFGWGPLSEHIVTFTEIDHERLLIRTTEQGGPVTQWDHTMTLEPVGADRTRYTDSLELRAGLLTGIVWLFAFFFYRHRHRRWLLLLVQP
jgi:hypothetical protein